MDIQDIINLYNEGKSLSFIANKYNTYGAKIKRILKYASRILVRLFAFLVRVIGRFSSTLHTHNTRKQTRTRPLFH